MKPKCLERVRELDGMIEKAGVVTLIAHTHPDGDAIGSGIAMLHYLKERRGKDVKLIVPDPVPDTISFLTAAEDPADLLVYDRQRAEADARLSGSDLILCQDFNALSRTEGMEHALRASDVPKVLIDHHLYPDTAAFALTFSLPDISSTSELLFWILKDMADIGGDVSKLPPVSLRALLTGMTTDTNNFANSVFPGTLQMASELLSAGVDRDAVLAELYSSYRENRLRLMGFLLYEKLRITPSGLAYMILTRAEQQRFDMREGESEGFVNLPLEIGKVRLSLFLKEDDGHFRVSARSKKGVSANACAMAWFHGGGHEQAAGGKLFFPGDIPAAQDAEAYILKVCEQFFKP